MEVDHCSTSGWNYILSGSRSVIYSRRKNINPVKCSVSLFLLLSARCWWNSTAHPIIITNVLYVWYTNKRTVRLDMYSRPISIIHAWEYVPTVDTVEQYRRWCDSAVMFVGMNRVLAMSTVSPSSWHRSSKPPFLDYSCLHHDNVSSSILFPPSLSVVDSIRFDSSTYRTDRENGIRIYCERVLSIHGEGETVLIASTLFIPTNITAESPASILYIR